MEEEQRPPATHDSGGKYTKLPHKNATKTTHIHTEHQQTNIKKFFSVQKYWYTSNTDTYTQNKHGKQTQSQ